MSINYGKVVNEVFKVLKGLGYSTKLYNSDGDGPLSSPWVAKYIWTMPYNIMFEMPDTNSNAVKEILIYKSNSIDIDKFRNIFDRVKNIARLYGIEVTVRSFNKEITPKDFAFKPKANAEELKSLEESLAVEPQISHLRYYLDLFK